MTATKTPSGMEVMLANIMKQIDLPAMLTKMGFDPVLIVNKLQFAADKVKTFDARLTALENLTAENNRLLQELKDGRGSDGRTDTGNGGDGSGA